MKKESQLSVVYVLLELYILPAENGGIFPLPLPPKAHSLTIGAWLHGRIALHAGEDQKAKQDNMDLIGNVTNVLRRSIPNLARINFP